MTTHHIGLIVMGASTLQDYQIFIKTLGSWEKDVHLWVFTDSASEVAVRGMKTSATVHIKACLDAYSGKNRQQMEAVSGKVYKTQWTDFMYEKAAVLEWMFAESGSSSGAWFLDADIAFLAPLPAIPADAKVALSPHFIRPGDEARYGKYNGGFTWFGDKTLVDVWKAAGFKARFYEQSALEDVAAAAGTGLYEFPIQVNFGWWRMFQASESAATIQERFSINRSDHATGIRYDGAPLQSIHTHFYDTTSATGAFNAWLDGFSNRFKVHGPIRNFRRAVQFS
jgi:hypothetical protein